MHCKLLFWLSLSQNFMQLSFRLSEIFPKNCDFFYNLLNWVVLVLFCVAWLHSKNLLCPCHMIIYLATPVTMKPFAFVCLSHNFS